MFPTIMNTRVTDSSKTIITKTVVIQVICMFKIPQNGVFRKLKVNNT